MSNDSLVPASDSYALAAELACVQGDLSKLSSEHRLAYYGKVCASVGLNPFTQPFDYVHLNGKLTLYTKKNATDQIREIKKVSIRIVSKGTEDDVYIVHVEARLPDGRQDEDLGVVLLGQLKGEAKANAIMKAITKAKRRVTLSICGLGFLDETEVESIPGAQYPAVDPQTHTYAQTEAGTVDTSTGEVVSEEVKTEAAKPATIPIKQQFINRAKLFGFNATISKGAQKLARQLLCKAPDAPLDIHCYEACLRFDDELWQQAITELSTPTADEEDLTDEEFQAAANRILDVPAPVLVAGVPGAFA